MKGRSVLVTGCNGALGHAVARALLASGAAVTGMVRPGRPLPEGVARIEVEAYADAVLRRHVDDTRHDVVIHLAAYGVKPDERDPDMMQAVNVEGTRAVVDHAARIGAGRIIVAGSCAEYADDAPLPLRAGAPEQKERLYGASKARATHLALDRAASLGLDAAVLRVFNVYGPDEGPRRLLQAIAAGLASGTRVALSPGLQTRDFVFGDDVAEAFVAAAARNATGIIDICTGTGTTVRAFAETVARTMGADPALLGFGDQDMRPDDIPVILGDPAAMNAELGYHPRHTVETGIRHALERMAKTKEQPR